MLTLCRESVESATVEPNEATGDESLTSANSLPVWLDWVQHYCTHVPKTSAAEDNIPFSHQ